MYLKINRILSISISPRHLHSAFSNFLSWKMCREKSENCNEVQIVVRGEKVARRVKFAAGMYVCILRFSHRFLGSKNRLFEPEIWKIINAFLFCWKLLIIRTRITCTQINGKIQNSDIFSASDFFWLQNIYTLHQSSKRKNNVKHFDLRKHSSKETYRTIWKA